MNLKLHLSTLALAATFLCAVPAEATPLGPSSGFLPTYAGPQNGDFDIASGEAFLKGSNFIFDATFNAPIGTTPGVAYVWGVDRGLNIAPFNSFRPGVLFDAVVISIPSANQAFVIDVTTNVLTPLPTSDVDINGNSLSITVPTSFLPTEGFAFSDYLVNLWTRDGLNPADNTQIAEFAPSNSDVRVNAPEPVTLAVFGAGLAGAAAIRRRKKKLA